MNKKSRKKNMKGYTKISLAKLEKSIPNKLIPVALP